LLKSPGVFGIARAVPVLAGLAILGIGWGLRCHGDPYIIKGNIIFGQVENWTASVLFPGAGQFPPPCACVQAGATLVSAEDLSPQRIPAKRGVVRLQQEGVDIVLIPAIGGHGKYVVFLAGRPSRPKPGRAASRFQTVCDALPVLRARLDVSAPGLIN